MDVLATEDPDAVAEEHEELQIYEKHNNLLHGSKRKKYARSIFLGEELKHQTFDSGTSWCEKHS